MSPLPTAMEIQRLCHDLGIKRPPKPLDELSIIIHWLRSYLRPHIQDAAVFVADGANPADARAFPLDLGIRAVLALDYPHVVLYPAFSQEWTAACAALDTIADSVRRTIFPLLRTNAHWDQITASATQRANLAGLFVPTQMVENLCVQAAVPSRRGR